MLELGLWRRTELLKTSGVTLRPGPVQAGLANRDSDLADTLVAHVEVSGSEGTSQLTVGDRRPCDTRAWPFIAVICKSRAG